MFDFGGTPATTAPSLSQARVAIVTTAGLRADGQGTWTLGQGFVVLDDAERDLTLAHASPNFDRAGVATDLNVVYPVDRLDELAAHGCDRFGRGRSIWRSWGPSSTTPSRRCGSTPGRPPPSCSSRRRRRCRAAHAGLTAVHAHRECARPRARSGRVWRRSGSAWYEGKPSDPGRLGCCIATSRSVDRSDAHGDPAFQHRVLDGRVRPARARRCASACRLRRVDHRRGRSAAGMRVATSPRSVTAPSRRRSARSARRLRAAAGSVGRQPTSCGSVGPDRIADLVASSCASPRCRWDDVGLEPATRSGGTRHPRLLRRSGARSRRPCPCRPPGRIVVLPRHRDRSLLRLAQTIIRAADAPRPAWFALVPVGQPSS